MKKLILDSGVDRELGKEHQPDRRQCDCHKDGPGKSMMIHPGQCCSPCPVCFNTITVGSLHYHLQYNCAGSDRVLNWMGIEPSNKV